MRRTKPVSLDCWVQSRIQFELRSANSIYRSASVGHELNPLSLVRLNMAEPPPRISGEVPCLPWALQAFTAYRSNRNYLLMINPFLIVPVPTRPEEKMAHMMGG